MESIAESRLLSLLGGQSLGWLQIEVVVQMQVVEIFTVNEEIKHIVACKKKKDYHIIILKILKS